MALLISLLVAALASAMASCTGEGKDPWATGEKIPCCDGLEQKLEDWDGDSRWYDRCILPEASTTSKPPSGRRRSQGRRVTAKVTAYGYNDNDPPSADIAYPKHGMHGRATEGIGTFADPLTVASSKDEVPLGSLLYVTHLRKYFVMEDSCAGCIREWNEKQWHFDLWMGPNHGSQDWSKLEPCEYYVTRPAADVILDPPSDLPVDETPLFDGKSCTARVYDSGLGDFEDAEGGTLNTWLV